LNLSPIARYIAWLRRRLTPGEYLGLELTLGVLLFIAAAWLFGGIAEDVVSGDPLTQVDVKIALWMHEHERPALTAFMWAVSYVHSWPLPVMAALFLLYLAANRLWRWALIGLCADVGGVMLNDAVKLAFHRERPTFSGLSAALTTYSFPSGHALGTTILYGLIALYLISRTKDWRLRVFIVTVAAFLVILVASSRVYLGVHYVSDVVAGAAEGVAWLALCHAAITTWWQRRERRRALRSNPRRTRWP
jgi:membrane-associated phospholipid phosphatase